MLQLLLLLGCGEVLLLGCCSGGWEVSVAVGML